MGPSNNFHSSSKISTTSILNKKRLLLVQVPEQLPRVEAQVFPLPAGHGHWGDAQQPQTQGTSNQSSSFYYVHRLLIKEMRRLNISTFIHLNVNQMVVIATGGGVFYFATSAGVLEQSMGARNREWIGLSYRPVRQYRLAESDPSNRFLGPLKVLKYRHSSFNRWPMFKRNDDISGFSPLLNIISMTKP